MKDVVNTWADAFLPVKSVTVRAVANDGNRNVTIVYEGNERELFPQLKKASEEAETGWIYVEGERGVRWTSLTLLPENGEVTITAKKLPRLYLTVFGNRGGGILEFKVDGETVVQDCYRDVDSTELLRVYPSQHNNNLKLLIVIKAVLYLFLINVFATLFLFIGWFLKNKWYKGGRKLRWIREYFHRPITNVDFFICWVGLFALAVFIYKVIGIPNYLQIGDEAEYWISLILNDDGKWDVAMLASRFAPRGYWCYIPQSIAHYIGDAISVDPSIIWMLMPAATISWLVVKIFPGIYELMGGKAQKFHILPILILMITVWRAFLTSVLMDLFGIVFLFAGIYYTLHFFKTGKWMSAVMAGLMSSIACSFRAANLLGIVAVVIYEIIVQIARRREETGRAIKRSLIGIGAGVLSFVIICLPQLQVNLYRNHPGLLPYDHDQAWLGRSVTTWSSDYAMTTGNIAYPFFATDDQMLTMKKNVYSNDLPLNMEQLLDTYMESPIETVMLIGKKLLIGFDVKTNIAYPNSVFDVSWRATNGMFFSLWNYFTLFAGLYVLFKWRGVTTKEKTLAVLVFIFLVLPETFMKIEWRYVFAGYMMIYYFFTFHFVGELVQSKDKRVNLLEQSRFVPAFVVFALAYFTFSFIFLA